LQLQSSTANLQGKLSSSSG
jgi:chromosome segregation ATPase